MPMSQRREIGEGQHLSRERLACSSTVAWPKGYSCALATALSHKS